MFVVRGVCLLLMTLVCRADEYVIDDSVRLGRRFDGVGAISGGGVSCCLLQLVINMYPTTLQ